MAAKMVQRWELMEEMVPFLITIMDSTIFKSTWNQIDMGIWVAKELHVPDILGEVMEILEKEETGVCLEVCLSLLLHSFTMNLYSLQIGGGGDGFYGGGGGCLSGGGNIIYFVIALIVIPYLHQNIRWVEQLFYRY